MSEGAGTTTQQEQDRSAPSREGRRQQQERPLSPRFSHLGGQLLLTLSKVVLEICEETEVDVDRVPELTLGDRDSLRDLVVGAVPTGAASPRR